MFQLPVYKNNSPDYEFKMDLDGAVYTLRFYYSKRIENWKMSVYDENRNPLVTGIKVVPNYPLLDNYKFIEALPPGDFICLETTGKIEDNPKVTFDLLGTAFFLFYVEAADL